MGIKLDISEDYTSGQIAFDCQSIDDVRKIGAILDVVAFNMRYANIEFRNTKMDDYELGLLEALVYLEKFEKAIQDSSANLTGLKKQEAEKLRRIINFRYVQEIRQIIHDAKRLNMLRENE